MNGLHIDDEGPQDTLRSSNWMYGRGRLREGFIYTHVFHVLGDLRTVVVL
jgi:hypothetical protein